MSQQKFEQMGKAADAVFMAEQGKIQSLLQEEARIRADLAKLQTQAEEARNRLIGDMPMQSVGADMVWQGWLARSRKQLNLELAGVLARKASAMDKVRIAFGRRTAIQTLSENAREERGKARRERQLETLLLQHGETNFQK